MCKGPLFLMVFFKYSKHKGRSRKSFDKVEIGLGNMHLDEPVKDAIVTFPYKGSHIVSHLIRAGERTIKPDIEAI